MSAQERETKKNFIAIVSETAEEQRATERLTKFDQPARRGFFGLMADVLNRDINARRRSGQSPAPPSSENAKAMLG